MIAFLDEYSKIHMVIYKLTNNVQYCIVGDIHTVEKDLEKYLNKFKEFLNKNNLVGEVI